MLVKYKKNKKAHLYDDENPPFRIPPPEKPKGPFKSTEPVSPTVAIEILQAMAFFVIQVRIIAYERL